MQAGLEKAVAGNLCEEIGRAYFGALARYDFEKTTLRLLDRHGLSACVGPELRELPGERQDGTEPGNDVPFHVWSLVWRLGHRNHREHPNHRLAKSNLSNVPRKLLVID